MKIFELDQQMATPQGTGAVPGQRQQDKHQQHQQQQLVQQVQQQLMQLRK